LRSTKVTFWQWARFTQAAKFRAASATLMVVFFALHAFVFFHIVEGRIRFQRGYWDKVTWFVPLELSDRIELRTGLRGEKQEGMMGVSASASAQ